MTINYQKLHLMIRNRFCLVSRESLSTIQKCHPFSSYVTALSSQRSRSSGGEGLVFLLVASLMTAAASVTLRSSLEKEENRNYLPFSFQIEVDFVDKLARKSYLNFQRNDSHQRPMGVPTSLRILTVDLPEISRYGIVGGEGCRLAEDRVFPNGIAPPKPISLLVGANSTTIATSKTPLLIEQKVWATALYECKTSASSLPSVQILQASTSGLNPHNLRHTHQFGHYRYDPGKYESSSNRKEKEQAASASSQLKKKHQQEEDQQQSVAATAFDELEAPWHQYAWLDELQVRISGQVHFGETLEPAGMWGRYVWGHVYKRTVRPQSLFGSITGGVGAVAAQSRSRRRESTWELETGDDDCCASNKPHAVVANGAALQRVPHALRWLQKTCRDSNVPLYVVRDPRNWGGNTQLLQAAVGEDDEKDLGPTLRQVRRLVKDRIIQTCLRAGTGFERGRWVGRMETEVRWQAKELWRKSKQAFQPPPDWRGLDERQLEIKLLERGIIEERADDPTQKVYSSALVSLARKCAETAGVRAPGRSKTDKVVQTEQKTESEDVVSKDT